MPDDLETLAQEAPMTFGELLDQLNDFASHVGRDLPVRINGEYVENFTMTLQHPTALVHDDGPSHLEHDTSRSQVVDLTANDHKAPALPRNEYDRRRW